MACKDLDGVPGLIAAIRVDPAPTTPLETMVDKYHCRPLCSSLRSLILGHAHNQNDHTLLHSMDPVFGVCQPLEVRRQLIAGHLTSTRQRTGAVHTVQNVWEDTCTTDAVDGYSLASATDPRGELAQFMLAQPAGDGVRHSAHDALRRGRVRLGQSQSQASQSLAAAGNEAAFHDAHRAGVQLLHRRPVNGLLLCSLEELRFPGSPIFGLEALRLPRVASIFNIEFRVPRLASLLNTSLRLARAHLTR